MSLVKMPAAQHTQRDAPEPGLKLKNGQCKGRHVSDVADEYACGTACGKLRGATMGTGFRTLVMKVAAVKHVREWKVQGHCIQDVAELTACWTACGE